MRPDSKRCWRIVVRPIDSATEDVVVADDGEIGRDLEPRSRAALMTPSACVSLAAKIAVGGRGPVSNRKARSRAVRAPWAPRAASTSTPSPWSTSVKPM